MLMTEGGDGVHEMVFGPDMARNQGAVTRSGRWRREQRIFASARRAANDTDLLVLCTIIDAPSHPRLDPAPAPLAAVEPMPAYVALLDGPNRVPRRPIGIAEPSDRPDGPRAPSAALPRITGGRALP
jgi:hypothetical protein